VEPRLVRHQQQYSQCRPADDAIIEAAERAWAVAVPSPWPAALLLVALPQLFLDLAELQQSINPAIMYESQPKSAIKKKNIIGHIHSNCWSRLQQ
jgi:hypothetical protein